jgi:gliding motility associated protien GldN
MKIKNVVTVILVLTVGGNVSAQLPSSGMSESGVLDGVYVQEHIPTKRVIQYTHLREADVIWAKRVWRTIDLREKQNHSLYFPMEPLSDRRSLWDVIKYGIIEEGSITPYEPTDEFGNADDQFKTPITPPNGNANDPTYQDKLNELFYNISTEPKLDANGDEMFDELTGERIDTLKTEPIRAEEIIKYYIKEDWFFDKQRSVRERRIIGIAPVIYKKDEQGDIKGMQTKFWLYFPECRYVFQNFFVYNRKNDARRMSFDDLFWKQMYSSYIHKETNVFDRKINKVWEGVDALLESERIKKEIFTIEHDLWHL